MGFGHRIYRAEDPRSRILKRTARELGSPQLEVAEELERVALAALQKRHPERVLATNVEYYSAVVLDIAEIPPALAPAMFACSRVAGWSAHILEQKRTGRLFRPSAKYVGPGARGPPAATIVSAPSPTGRSGSFASTRRQSSCAGASRTKVRPAAVRLCFRSSCSRATIRASSTRAVRSSTGSPTTTRTRPFVAWR